MDLRYLQAASMTDEAAKAGTFRCLTQNLMLGITLQISAQKGKLANFIGEKYWMWDVIYNKKARRFSNLCALSF